MTAKAEVVAPVKSAFVAKRFPAVKAVEDAYGNCDAAMVEEEKNAPEVQIEEVVAMVFVAKLLNQVNAAAPAEVWSVAQPKEPLLHVRYCPPAQPPRPFTYSREVEATLEVMAVVEAYGKMLATVEVEVMLPAMNSLPWMESALPGVEVPMPILPFVPNIVRSGLAADTLLLSTKFLPLVANKSAFGAMGALALP